MQLNGVFEMQLETIENSIALEDVNTSSKRTVKVFIPKLMPLTKIENAKEQKFQLYKSNILNDSSCFPAMEYKTTIGNYIEVPLGNNSFIDKKIYKGDRILILLPNKNIKEMVAVDV